MCTAGGQLQTQVLSSTGCLYRCWAAADTSTVFNRLSVQLLGSCRHKYCRQQTVCIAVGQLQTQVPSSTDCLYRCWAAADTSTVFIRLSVQLLGSCRHKYCRQQTVCIAVGQLQTQVPSSTDCLYSWWAAADTSSAFNRLSVQLVCSCRHFADD